MTEFKIGDRVTIQRHVLDSYIGKTGRVSLIPESDSTFHVTMDHNGYVLSLYRDEIGPYRDPRDAALDAMSEVFKTADSDDEIIRQIHFILLGVGR